MDQSKVPAATQPVDCLSQAGFFVDRAAARSALQDAVHAINRNSTSHKEDNQVSALTFFSGGKLGINKCSPEVVTTLLGYMAEDASNQHSWSTANQRAFYHLTLAPRFVLDVDTNKQMSPSEIGSLVASVLAVLGQMFFPTQRETQARHKLNVFVAQKTEGGGVHVITNTVIANKDHACSIVEAVKVHLYSKKPAYLEYEGQRKLTLPFPAALVECFDNNIYKADSVSLRCIFAYKAKFHSATNKLEFKPGIYKPCFAVVRGNVTSSSYFDTLPGNPWLNLVKAYSLWADQSDFKAMVVPRAPVLSTLQSMGDCQHAVTYLSAFVNAWTINGTALWGNLCVSKIKWSPKRVVLNVASKDPGTGSSKCCPYKKADHKNNNIYFVLQKKLKTEVVMQVWCHDDVCKSVIGNNPISCPFSYSKFCSLFSETKKRQRNSAPGADLANKKK